MARSGNTKTKAKNVVRKPEKKSLKKILPAKTYSASSSSSRKKVSQVVSAKKSGPLKKITAALKKMIQPKKKTVSKLKAAASKKPLPAARKKTVPVSKKKNKTQSLLRSLSNSKKVESPKKTPLKTKRPAAASSSKETQKKPQAVSGAQKKIKKGASSAAPKLPRVKVLARSPALPKKKTEVPFRNLRITLKKKPKAVPSEKIVSNVPVYAAPEMPRELPGNYGDNLIYLLVRDPHWIYAYWELQRDFVEARRESLGGTWDQICTVLRVYDVTNGEASGYQDLYLGGITDHWHIHGEPTRSYFVEIGLLHQDGRFSALARSNSVGMPRDGVSDVLDEQWMDIDFDKVYALSGGFDVGKSSEELRRLMQERILGTTASGSGSGMGFVSSVTSPGSGSWGGVPVDHAKNRKFFFWLDCEVIVYGGTEPDAKVTFQGKVIKLRPDGTFSFRFALPDGKFVFDAKAESSDGLEERVITPTVERHTHRPAAIVKTEKT